MFYCVLESVLNLSGTISTYLVYQPDVYLLLCFTFLSAMNLRIHDSTTNITVLNDISNLIGVYFCRECVNA